MIPAVASAKQPSRTAMITGNLARGVDVILDHDLQAKRGVMEQGDQQQDHQGGDEGCPQPSDESRVIAAGWPKPP